METTINDDTLALRAGSRLQGGRYTIEKTLGEGGFGITYLATQAGQERRVAVKEFFMRQLCGRDATTSEVTVGSTGSRKTVAMMRRKFVKEAQTIARLDNQHVIRIHDIFEENGTAYYVMEYIAGGSLEDKVTERGYLPEEEAAGYACQIAEALSYIHERNILHLDIKPSNLLFRDDGEIVLIDFGMSKHYDEEGVETATSNVALSRGYASIEQYQTGGVSRYAPSSDIYSLGAVLYDMLTGECPPEATEMVSTPLSFPNYVGEEMRRIILKAMAPDRGGRYQSASDFKRALDSRTPTSGDDGETVVDDGNAEWQNDQGEKYYYGRGVERDYGKAVEWYRKSAEQGNAEAQNNLGDCYADGQGIEQDYGKAMEWFCKSVEQGNADAQNNLGDCYFEGYGVARDYAKAVEWFCKSTAQGNAKGQFNLGYCYDKGHGVERDYAKAVEWYRKSVAQGNADAQNNLGICYFYGRGVEQDYGKARELYSKAAAQGNVMGQNWMGYCYCEGCGVVRDYSKAVEWYRKAVAQGDAEAQNSLGYCYEKGYGVGRDYGRAVEWYSKAAAQGNARGQCSLGNCYADGHGVEQDYGKAVEWYRKAAEQGDASGQCYLGDCYFEGHGVECDYGKAVEWYSKAAEQGNEIGKLSLMFIKNLPIPLILRLIKLIRVC